MSITDGFSTADSLGALSGNTLIDEASRFGVSVKAYIQECQGLAQDGVHGWFHVGMDIVDDSNGEVIDSIPYQQNSDVEHPGHYTHDRAVEEAHSIVQDYIDAAAKAGTSGSVDEDEWKATFITVRDLHRAQSQMNNMLLSMMLGNMSETDPEDDFVNALMAMLDDEDVAPPGPDNIAPLMGDFDPFVAGPTDEGL